MLINCLIEGGIGDALAATRFVFGIRQKYPDAIIKGFFSTDENDIQPKFVTSLYPSLYNGGWEHIRRKNKEFKISSQFGEENIPAVWDNIVEEDKWKFLDANSSYNLWLDGLEFLKYPECMSCYNYWPRPEVIKEYNLDLPQKFALLHPFARPNTERKLEEWYVKKLVKEISDNIPVVIVTEQKHLDYYEFCKNWENVQVIPVDLHQIVYIASKASVFLGVDSSIRYIANFFCPTYVYNNFCTQPLTAPAFQAIRWIPNEKSCLPPNFDISFVKKLILGAAADYANFLFPNFQFSGQSLDSGIVRRIFT